MKPNNLKFINVTFILTILSQVYFVDDMVAENVVTSSKRMLEINDSIATENFIINVPSTGRYYCNFWMIPALRSNGTLTSFKVSLNGNFIGYIHPKTENWQSASISDKPYIDLIKGDNKVSISSDPFEIPEVESIRISTSSQVAEISSNLYNEYIDKIISNDGIVDKEINDNGICLMSDDNGSLIISQKSSLNYSFYKLLYLKEGEEFVASATTNSFKNALDLFYYGEIDSTTNYINDLSWKQIGEPVISATSDRKNPTYTATLKVRIPRTGIYMLKPRTIRDRVANITNVNINGMTYNKVPVYYSHIDCIMPADGIKYTAYTVCDNPETDDPMIFVEGNAGNRIVGFNDNISENDRKLYHDPSEKDALVNLSYKVETSGLHVTSNNSNNPLSSCMVYGGINISRPSFAPKKLPLKNMISNVKDNRINNVKIFDKNGFFVKKVQATDSGDVHIGNLNAGVYILCTTNNKGEKSTHKIIVK